MFSREPFLYESEIRSLIALHCLQTSKGNLQNMFSGNRCYKIWLLCTYVRNHSKNISTVAYRPSVSNFIKNQNSFTRTTLCKKCKKYGLSLIRIFCIWTESYPYFPLFGQIYRFCPNKGKYGYDSDHIRGNTDKRKPVLRYILRTAFLCRSFVMV